MEQQNEKPGAATAGPRNAGSSGGRNANTANKLRGRGQPTDRKFPQLSREDFEKINRTAQLYFPELVARWVPHGKRRGKEWVGFNPTRTDKHAGSFSINLHTGRWADFATGARGGDVISLAAYISGLSQSEAALQLAEMLGVRL